MMYCGMQSTFAGNFQSMKSVSFFFLSPAIYLIAKKGETPLKTRNNKGASNPGGVLKH